MKKLSILMPSIKPDNLKIFIDSVDYPNYELIIVGPYELLDLKDFIIERKLQHKIKIVTDYGNPVRAFQIAASLATGDIITDGSDDETYHPGYYEKIMSIFENKPENFVVSCAYTEDKETNIEPPEHFLLYNPHPTTSIIKKDWFCFLLFFMNRKYYEKLGGVDCTLQTYCVALDDLAIRAYLDGAEVLFITNPVAHVTWFQGHVPPGTHPIHKPQYITQYELDPLVFNIKTFKEPIMMDNWKQSESIWTLRYKNE